MEEESEEDGEKEEPAPPADAPAEAETPADPAPVTGPVEAVAGVPAPASSGTVKRSLPPSFILAGLTNIVKKTNNSQASRLPLFGQVCALRPHKYGYLLKKRPLETLGDFLKAKEISDGDFQQPEDEDPMPWQNTRRSTNHQAAESEQTTASSPTTRID